MDQYDIPMPQQTDIPMYVPVQPYKKGKKWLIPVIAAACAVILALVLMLSLSGGSNFTALEHSIRLVTLNDDERLVIFDTEDPVRIALDYNTSLSPTGQALVYQDEENDNTLYYLEAGQTAVQLAKNVSFAQFSANGEYIVYSRIENKELQTISLYIVETGKTEATCIVSDMPESVLRFSPDAQSLYYAKDGKHYLWRDGETVSFDLPKDYSVVAISNDADLIYSYKYDDESDTYTAYVQEDVDGERTKLLKTDSFNGALLNKDGSEMLIVTEKAIYLSQEGKEAQKLLGSGIDELLFPAYTIRSCSLSRSAYLNTFVGVQIIAGNQGLYTLGENDLETVKLASDVSTAHVALDGESLIYVKDNVLYRVDDVWSENSAEPLVENLEILEVIASPDLKEIYIETVDDDLYYVDGDDAVRVSGASDIDAVHLNADGSVCFIERDGEWYYTEGGDAIEKVTGIEEDAYLYVGAAHVVIVGEDAVYVSDGDADFEKIATRG